MKQVHSNLTISATKFIGVPSCAVPCVNVLLSTLHTLLSAGIEQIRVDFGKANPIEKASRLTGCVVSRTELLQTR